LSRDYYCMSRREWQEIESEFLQKGLGFEVDLSKC